MGYLPKFAGPLEDELLASISTPSVRSYACLDFSVLNVKLTLRIACRATRHGIADGFIRGLSVTSA
jgi:hypothetical protein